VHYMLYVLHVMPVERLAMRDDELVVTVEEATANILRFEKELERSAGMRAVMSYVRAWHAERAADGGWRVAPSKYVGYRNNDAEAYVKLHNRRDGRRTERALAAWFDEVTPASPRYDEINAAALRLFAKYGRAPNKLFRVHALRDQLTAHPANLSRSAGRDRVDFRSRITIDPGISGGRPTIRKMRIRVSDILDLLAAGATRKEILADFPYLEDEDISASLAFAAESASNPIVAAY
jgi:uncharacterized protein (DUF433 family)